MNCCSASLWHVPAVVGGGRGPLPSARVASYSHQGKVEDWGLGIPSTLGSSWSGVLGLVSTHNYRVRLIEHLFDYLPNCVLSYRTVLY